MPQTAITANKLNTKIDKLEQEIRILRSFLISIVGEDRDGKYRSEFVKEILKAAKKKPNYIFSGGDSFLAALKRI